MKKIKISNSILANIDKIVALGSKSIGVSDLISTYTTRLSETLKLNIGAPPVLLLSKNRSASYMSAGLHIITGGGIETIHPGGAPNVEIINGNIILSYSTNHRFDLVVIRTPSPL